LWATHWLLYGHETS
jgi:hypothetical protein